MDAFSAPSGVSGEDSAPLGQQSQLMIRLGQLSGYQVPRSRTHLARTVGALA